MSGEKITEEKILKEIGFEWGKNYTDYEVVQFIKKIRQKVKGAIDKVISKKYPQGIIINQELKKELGLE